MGSVKINFIYSAGFQLINIIVPLFTMPYLTRILGSRGIGIYSYAFSVASYFSLFILLGLYNYGSRTIAGIRNNKVILSRTFSEIYIFQFICGIFVLILYGIYLIWFCNIEFIGLAFVIHILSVILDITWFFNGLEKFKILAIRNTFIKIISMILIFCFVKEENDLGKYCFILTGSSLFASIFFWICLKNEVVWIKPTINGILKHIKPNLILFVTVLIISLYRIMDKIMLGLMSTYDQVGFFEITEKMTSIPLSFINAFGIVMLPHISNMLTINRDYGRRTTYVSIIFVMFMSSSISFGIMAISNEFIPLFFGNGYRECIYLFLVNLPSCIFIGFANVLRTQYLIPHKMDVIYIKSTVLGAIVNVILNTILIQLYGAFGASISTLAAEIVVCTYQAFKLRLILPIKKYVIDSIPFVFSGIFMFILVFTSPAFL